MSSVLPSSSGAAVPPPAETVIEIIKSGSSGDNVEYEVSPPEMAGGFNDNQSTDEMVGATIKHTTDTDTVDCADRNCHNLSSEVNSMPPVNILDNGLGGTVEVAGEYDKADTTSALNEEDEQQSGSNEICDAYANEEDGNETGSSAIMKDILEKKWTSLVKLKK